MRLELFFEIKRVRVEVEDWRKPGPSVSPLQACIYGVKSPNPRLGSRILRQFNF
jgi:hypothetical protein